jgi:hypothetical protein
MLQSFMKGGFGEPFAGGQNEVSDWKNFNSPGAGHRPLPGAHVGRDDQRLGTQKNP